MSASPDFLEPDRDRDREHEREPRAAESGDDSIQTLWHWFAVGLLLVCWFAEASMCADRGF